MTKTHLNYIAEAEEVLFIDAYNQTTGMARAQVGLKIQMQPESIDPLTAIGKVYATGFYFPFQCQLHSSHEPAFT